MEFFDTLKDESFKPWFDTFARDGHAPQPGEIWKSEDHAETLKKIAKTHAKASIRENLRIRSTSIRERLVVIFGNLIWRITGASG